MTWAVLLSTDFSCFESHIMKFKDTISSLEIREIREGNRLIFWVIAVQDYFIYSSEITDPQVAG